MNSHIQHLQNIKQTFNISVPQLAVVFSVPFKSIYCWLDGDITPNKEQYCSILQFSRAADVFKENGVVNTNLILEMRIFDDKSMLDLIADCKLTEDDLKVLVERALLLDKEYSEIRMYQSESKPHDDWHTITTPITGS